MGYHRNVEALVIRVSVGWSGLVLIAILALCPAVSNASKIGVVARPPYNTGQGFFVLNGKLYDPKGEEFRIRGVNRVHWDSDSAAGIAKSNANTVRTFIDFTRPVASNIDIIQTQNIDQKEVPIVTYAGSGSTPTSCSSEATTLVAAVSAWTSQASSWIKLDKYMLVNVANEWGPSNSAVWRDSYIAAIKSLRSAGYLAPIVVDSGGCGQDPKDFLIYSTAVFNSDPQKNIIFSFHDFSPVSSLSYFPQFAALAEREGMVFIIGEFGPGKNIGPSPTLLTPAQVITTAEANGLGWIAWAWDDNDLRDGKSDNKWFSMTYSGPGVYKLRSDLTDYGQDVVLSPTYGISALAKRASIF